MRIIAPIDVLDWLNVSVQNCIFRLPLRIVYSWNELVHMKSCGLCHTQWRGRKPCWHRRGEDALIVKMGITTQQENSQTLKENSFHFLLLTHIWPIHVWNGGNCWIVCFWKLQTLSDAVRWSNKHFIWSLLAPLYSTLWHPRWFYPFFLK